MFWNDRHYCYIFFIYFTPLSRSLNIMIIVFIYFIIVFYTYS